MPLGYWAVLKNWDSSTGSTGDSGWLCDGSSKVGLDWDSLYSTVCTWPYIPESQVPFDNLKIISRGVRVVRAASLTAQWGPMLGGCPSDNSCIKRAAIGHARRLVEGAQHPAWYSGEVEEGGQQYRGGGWNSEDPPLLLC